MFSGGILTIKGLALMSKVMSGQTNLVFTKIKIGDGELGSSAPQDLSDLKHIIKTLDIRIANNNNDGTFDLTGYFSNQGLTTGFYWREVGLYATDPQLGEILYSYDYAISNPEYIAAEGGPTVLEKTIRIGATIGSAQNVSAVINSSLIYASKSDIESVQNETPRWGGTATKSGDVYSISKPTISALAEGMAVSFKCSADSTGTPKLNWDGKGAKLLKKQNGSTPILKKDGIYTVRYSESVFQLQGEGASGNATASDLLLGKTAETDEGPIAGIIPLRGGEEYPGWRRATSDFLNDMVGRACFKIPIGAYLTGTPQAGGDVGIFCDDEGFAATNIPSNVNIFGLQGTIPVRAGSSVEANGSCTDNVAKLLLRPPHGIYDGNSAWIHINSPGFISTNFPVNVNVFGMQGTMTVKSSKNGNGTYLHHHLSEESASLEGSVFLRPLLGNGKVCYDGAQGDIWIQGKDPNFVSANFPTNVSLFGLQGTMPLRGGEEYPGWRRATSDFLNDVAGRACFKIPKGAYLTGTPQAGGDVGIFCDDAEFIGANFPANKNIFGLQGTMPLGISAPAIIRSQPNYVVYTPSYGYYYGQEIYAFSADFIASNILKSKSIYGLEGTAVKAETATVTNPTLSGSLNMSGGQYLYNSSATYSTSGLTFTPKSVVVKCTISGGTKAGTDGTIGGWLDIESGSFGQCSNWVGHIKLDVALAPTANGGTVTLTATLQGPSDTQKSANFTIQSIKFIA